MNVRVVGAGLIGTSIALALKNLGSTIEIVDISAKNQSIARDLVGSVEISSPDVVVIATPVEAILEVLQAEFERYPQSIFIDIGGLKSKVIAEVERFPDLARRFCSTHPMAGREVSGPQGARSDLFQGRVWIITPTSKSEPEVTLKAVEIAKSLGSTVLELPADAHDFDIALVSHLPQILSSALGGALIDASKGTLALSGQGLRDVSRLAAGDSDLWSSLLSQNSEHLIPHLKQLHEKLSQLIDAISKKNSEGIKKFLVEGNAGRALIPGKHGGRSREYFYLPIVIEDKPGQLAAIFQECAEISVNVEDLLIEHSPGQQTGLITLALSGEDSQRMHEHLLKKGWLVHQPGEANS